MSLDFTNNYNDYIVEPLKELMRNEFKGIPIGTDEHSGHQSFKLNLLPHVLVDYRSGGELRQYFIEIEYQYEKGGQFKKRVTEQLSNISERINKIIYDYRNFKVRAEWVDMSGTWGSTTTVWGNDITTYCWHSARIEAVDFERDEDEEEDKNKRTVKMLFQCFREESS